MAGGGLTVLFASRVLELSAGVIGLAFGAGATGAVLGAAMAPMISRRTTTAYAPWVPSSEA
jgi:hypothetical protein